jgi:hypothetical protein
MKKLDGRGEGGVVDMGTLVQDPEQIYVSTVINPKAGNQIVTAHRSAQGAEAQVDELATTWKVDRETLQANVLKLPLLP